MPFALSPKSVDATADAIMSLWDQVSAFEEFPSMRALTYPPHITFAIYDSPGASEQLAIATLEKAAGGRAAIELCFDRIRTFDGPPLILWADPEPKTALREIHDQVHAAIDPGLCHPHYRPGSWVPHCTLAMHSPGSESGCTGVCWRLRRKSPRRVRCDGLCASRPVAGRGGGTTCA
jgi:2'-5' RNA ligase